MVEDGVHLAVTSFEARDGVRITRVYNTFESPAAATAFLANRVADFDKVIKREPKKDKQGKVVGVRVQAVSISKVSKTEFANVLWTDHSTFCWLTSVSLSHVLEFEKQYP